MAHLKTLAFFLPGRAKDLSTPLYISGPETALFFRYLNLVQREV